MSLLPLLAVWIGDGALGTCGRTVLRSISFIAFSVYFCPNSTSVGHFTRRLNLLVLMDLNLAFHGHVGPCRMSSVFRHIFGWISVCVYIYIYEMVQLTLVMQVAVVCVVSVGFGFGLK